MKILLEEYFRVKVSSTLLGAAMGLPAFVPARTALAALRKHRGQHAFDRIQLSLDLGHPFQLHAQLFSNRVEFVLNGGEDL
jgi:hypothetical protein